MPGAPQQQPFEAGLEPLLDKADVVLLPSSPSALSTLLASQEND